MRQGRVPNFALFPALAFIKRQRNRYANVREPLSAPFQRQRQMAESCSNLNANIRQAPAKQIHQRQGANFCSLFNAGAP
jgi:hypothetical protein